MLPFFVSGPSESLSLDPDDRLVRRYRLITGSGLFLTGDAVGDLDFEELDLDRDDLLEYDDELDERDECLDPDLLERDLDFLDPDLDLDFLDLDLDFLDLDLDFLDLDLDFLDFDLDFPDLDEEELLLDLLLLVAEPLGGEGSLLFLSSRLS